MTESLLRVEGLSFSYTDSKKILGGVYLDLKAGTIVGIAGRNGSGKSTLFHCLVGVLKFNGALFWKGHYLEATKCAREVGFLPQTSFLPGEATVGKVLGWLGYSIPDARIEGLRDRRIRELSSGERRYLEFLIVVLNSREVLILDEPFSAIEPIYVEDMVRVLKERSAGRAILISDHNFPHLKAVCDEFQLLDSGVMRPVLGEGELRRLGYLV